MFDLQQVTVEHVSESLSGLNSSKATGLDNIPARFVKDGSKCIAYPPVHIFNLSLRSGIIPQDLKSARVTPLHKKTAKLRQETIDQSLSCVLFPKYWRKLFSFKLTNI